MGDIISFMPQSLAKNYIHLVFATRGRTETIPKVHFKEIHAVKQYIDNQEEHHKGVSFEDEFRKICKMYNVDLDERYVWD